MAIETNTNSVSPKAPDTADSRGRKASGQTGAGPATGFMAILSAMDEPVVSVNGLSDENYEQKVPLAPADIAQPATDLIANSNEVPVMIAPVAALDPALHGQFAMLVSPLGAGGAALAQGGAIAIEADPVSAGPLAQTAGAPAAAAQALTRMAVATSVAGSEDAPMADLMQGQPPTRTGDKTGAKAKALPALDQGGARAIPDSPRLQEARFMATLEAMRGVQEGGPAEAALLTSTVAVSQGEKPVAERGRFQERVAEGGFSAQPMSLGTTSYASPAVQDMGAVSPEMYVAQEVSYWISRDIQNAELKLDGLGLEAVEVSITVHGNEAHVAFRTDELQARTMLEGAAAHLKEALQGEGLVLSGVSVGTSGGRDTGDNERKQRQGVRQTAAVPVSLEIAGAHRPRGGATGRTLDLFV